MISYRGAEKKSVPYGTLFLRVFTHLHDGEELDKEQRGDHVGQNADILSLAGEHLDKGVGDEAQADGVPALYFEIAPNYFSYGCGYWDASPATMAKLRRRIETDPKRLEKLVRKLNKSRFTLSGEQFKRPKGDVGKLLNPWYNAKNIAVGYDDNPEGVLFTPELKDEVLAGFRELMGLYLYLDSLAGDPEPNKE